MYPKKPHKLDTEWNPELQIVRTMSTRKNSEKQSLKNRQNYQNCLNLGTPGATKLQPNCNLFATFCIPSRGPKRVAQGFQKVPKGFQKVAKRHEKDIQKASTRHPNAISKCIENSIGNSISNAIADAIATATGYRSPLRSTKTNTRTGWVGGSDNSLRSDVFLEIKLFLYTKF